MFRSPFGKLRPPKQPHDALQHLTWRNLEKGNMSSEDNFEAHQKYTEENG